MGNIASYITSEKAFYEYKRRTDTDAYDTEPVQKSSNISLTSATQCKKCTDFEIELHFP